MQVTNPPQSSFSDQFTPRFFLETRVQITIANHYRIFDLKNFSVQSSLKDINNTVHFLIGRPKLRIIQENTSDICIEESISDI